jgi:HK97 family phage portal protein
MNLVQFFGLDRLGVTWSAIDDRWYGPIYRRTSSGVSVTEDTAKNYSAVWACTRLLAGTGASLPLNLYRQLGGGGKAVARNHPTHQRLHFEPNPHMGSMQFRALGLDRQVNRGNFYAEIERDQLGRPAALWPIHPTRIPKGAEEENGRRVYHVTNDRAPPTTINAADMFHVPSIITRDGVNGIGVVTAARESIGFGIATERHGAAYFGNGARPSVALKHPKKFTDKEAREDLRRQWNEIHQGPDNNGKVALLQEGMEAQVLSFSQEDQQFLQTRQHNVEEQARWYGVPPHLIGHLLRSTFNNIEVQSLEFVVFSLLPWLVLWEQEAQRKLLTEEERAAGLYVKHVVDALLRGDSKARAEFYKAMRGLGVFSANDILELEDRNPIGPAGDKRFVPLNWASLEKAGEIPEPKAAPALPPPREDPEEDGDEDEEPGLLRVIADRFGALAAQQAMLHVDVLEQVEERLKALPAPAAEPRGPTAHALAAAYEVLNDVVQRMLTKEQIAAGRRAAKSGAELFAWIDPFYEHHEQLMAKACLAPVRLILELEGKEDDPQLMAEALAHAHVQRSRDELLAAMECQADELAGRVDEVLTGWKENRRVVYTEAKAA